MNNFIFMRHCFRSNSPLKIKYLNRFIVFSMFISDRLTQKSHDRHFRLAFEYLTALPM
jgi:hypothetical protein